MGDINTPGVYIEEIPHFPPSVAEVESAVPAFTGYTEKAKKENDDDLLLVPTVVSSLPEYELFFGGPGDQPFVLYHSLRSYFDNGGGDCYIVCVGKYNNSIEKNAFLGGLEAISKVDRPGLLLFPDAVNLPGTELYSVQQAALAQAATLKDRFCILDLKQATDQQAHSIAVNEFRSNIGIANLHYSAAYTPHLKIQIGSNEMVIPSSGAVAGVYSFVDKTRGVWKGPSNISLNMVIDVAYNINDREQDSLNVDTDSGKSINAIRPFTGKGILVWGARTLAGNDNEWRYVSVRRFFIMVGESIKRSTQWVVFEPNDANTWVKVKGMIENYLTQKWRTGALQGAKPEHAFYVKIGLGQTMTAFDILEGRLIVEIGMAMVRPAEFIILRFMHKTMES